MSWSFQADMPIYTQLVARLQEQIVSGVYPPGGKLPSVRDLAAEAGVNPNTVQRAFADLEREGLIYTQRTAGKFVAEDAAVVGAARLLRVYRLTHDPDKAADYDASLKDERTSYVANKARSMALYICIYVQFATALAVILIFKQTLVGQALCALTCVQSHVYTGCFWYYNRKY